MEFRYLKEAPTATVFLVFVSQKNKIAACDLANRLKQSGTQDRHITFHLLPVVFTVLVFITASIHHLCLCVFLCLLCFFAVAWRVPGYGSKVKKLTSPSVTLRLSRTYRISSPVDRCHHTHEDDRQPAGSQRLKTGGGKSSSIRLPCYKARPLVLKTNPNLLTHNPCGKETTVPFEMVRAK